MSVATVSSECAETMNAWCLLFCHATSFPLNLISSNFRLNDVSKRLNWNTTHSNSDAFQGLISFTNMASAIAYLFILDFSLAYYWNFSKFRLPTVVCSLCQLWASFEAYISSIITFFMFRLCCLSGIGNIEWRATNTNHKNTNVWKIDLKYFAVS